MSLIEAKAVWKRTDFFFSSRRRHTRWTGDWKFRRVLFRSYADSGMIPWLLITQIMSQRKASLSQLVGERMRAFPASRSEERRVGKECRSGWMSCHIQKNKSMNEINMGTRSMETYGLLSHLT